MSSPVLDIASFAEALRSRGMTVTPDQVADMARSFSLIDPAKRGQVHAALGTLAMTDPGHRVPYDEEFRRFFDDLVPAIRQDSPDSRVASVSGMKPVVDVMPESIVEEGVVQTGTSSIENVAFRDFTELDDGQLAQARQMVLTMLWQPSDVRTRRWAPDRRGPRPDLRRSLHGAVGPEGDLMRLEMLQRRKKQRPLIVIADISGSMERYAELFLVFAHATLHRLRHVEAFTFSTHLTRITEDLKRRDANNALSLVTHTVTDWSGGTMIGDALAEWNKTWSRRLARGGPIVLVLSDGWDCGEPRLLAQEMARLSRSVHRVIWLNPLAARAEYEPATRGMKAIFPHIDHLLPAASVNDLKGVVRLIESINGTGRG